MTKENDTFCADFDALTAEARRVLERLIAMPSVSRDEAKVADFIEEYLTKRGAQPRRHLNNIWCEQRVEKGDRPTLLLNAHIDTVKPAATWTRDPFAPTLEDGRLYGLGSNDCGGGLCTLMQVFLALIDTPTPYHLVYLASAEEEVSGRNGIEAALPLLPPIDVAIVGEPTGMQPAIAEKGLMVLDCTAHGRSGHAARNEGVNALYEALPDIEWFRTFQFPKVSPLLGAVKTSVTMLSCGTQHNVVPDKCTFVVDVRSNECYTNPALVEEIRKHVRCDVVPRSTRLSSSRIEADHPLVQKVVALGGTPYGSPTLSDQALMPFPSFKMGPGESARSHTADEFVCLDELRGAVETYYRVVTEVQ